MEGRGYTNISHGVAKTKRKCLYICHLACKWPCPFFLSMSCHVMCFATFLTKIIAQPGVWDSLQTQWSVERQFLLVPTIWITLWLNCVLSSLSCPRALCSGQDAFLIGFQTHCYIWVRAPGCETLSSGSSDSSVETSGRHLLFIQNGCDDVAQYVVSAVYKRDAVYKRASLGYQGVVYCAQLTTDAPDSSVWY